MTGPAVSVVVPSRGGATRIGRLLDSLAGQSEQDFDVVVVVDGDIDDTAAVLAKEDRIGVRAIVFAENRGRSAALNEGFTAATGEILVRCDDDLVLPRDYVATQIGWHRAQVGGLIGLCRNFYPDNAYARVYGVPMDLHGRAAAYAAPAPRRWRHWGANVSVPRALWEQVGPYDTDTYRSYGWEDVDWGWRLHELGHRIDLLAELEAEHHVAATTATIRARRAYHSGAARTLFEAKHGDSMLPPIRPENPGPWNRLVGAVADRLDEAGVARWGARIDRTLGSMPAAIGRKQVALLVEAAAEAGYRRPGSIAAPI